MVCLYGGVDVVPELPEVETTRLGVGPLLEGRYVSTVNVRNPNLRQPVLKTLPRRLKGQRLVAVERRAKYLLFRFDTGTLITHLGMSGSLRVVSPRIAFKKHEHVEIIFDSTICLRLHDQNRGHWGRFIRVLIHSHRPIESPPI